MSGGARAAPTAEPAKPQAAPVLTPDKSASSTTHHRSQDLGAPGDATHWLLGGPDAGQSIQRKPIDAGYGDIVAAAGTGVQDAAEREADRAAAPLVRGERVQVKAAPGNGATTIPRPPATGGGDPLPARERTRYERGLGIELAGVRVHHDARAAQLTDEANAVAMTCGTDVYFGPGAYTPQSRAGELLLAHELTHVAQQAASGTPGVQRQPRGANTPASAGPAPPLDVSFDLSPAADPARAGERVSTSSDSRAGASLDATAYQWVRQHGPQLVRELIAALGNTALTLDVPELAWRSGPAAFIGAVFAPISSAADGDLVWSVLPSYLLPDSVAQTVDIGRDCYPAPFGPSEWKPGVVSEFTRRIVLRLSESLGRLARRHARHRAREWNPQLTLRGPVGSLVSAEAAGITPTHPFATGLAAVVLGPVEVSAGVAFSHPIDPYVYAALRATTELNAPAYRAAHPDEFTAEAVAADARLLRRVHFRFLAGEGLPSWIRVTEPIDATTEEVANELYGDSTAASRLSAAPPLFGLPRDDMPAQTARSRLPQLIVADGQGRALPPDRPEWRPSLEPAVALALTEALRNSGHDPGKVGVDSPERELLVPPDPQLVDSLALGAASRIMPTPGANRELIVERLAIIANRLAEMVPDAAALAHPPDVPHRIFVIGPRSAGFERYTPPQSQAIAARLQQVRNRVLERLPRIGAQGASAEVLQWDGQTHGQLEIVNTCAIGLANTRTIAEQYRGWPSIYNLIIDIADGYVSAAEISDIYGPGRARLDMAERRSVLFPITAMELMLATLRPAIAEARKSEVTSIHVDTSLYGVDEMDKTEQGLRNRLAQLRGLLLGDPRRASAELRRILDEINKLQTGVAVAVNLDTVDRVWQALQDSRSFMGQVRATFDGGNKLLGDAQQAALQLKQQWFQILLEWRYGDRELARRKLREKAEGREWRTWISKISTLIRDQADLDHLMTFAAMIGIAVLSGGLAGYIGAAAGVAWGTGAGLGVEVLAETTLFTGMSYPITARDPSLGDFAEQFGTNLLFIGGGRLLGRGFQGLIGAERAATAGGRWLTHGVVAAGMTGINLAMANEQSNRARGHGLSSREAGSLAVENVAFIGATALASALLRRPLAALRLQGELDVLGSRHRRSLEILGRTLAEVQRTAAPDAGLKARLTEHVERAVRSEQALTDRLARVVAEADAHIRKGTPAGAREATHLLRSAGITDEVAAQLRSGEITSATLSRVRAMQAMRVARALHPVGLDFSIDPSMYGEAEAYYRSLSGTLVIGAEEAAAPRLPGDLVTNDLPPPRIEPGGRSFEVRPAGERGFRVFERRAGAGGALADRVELARSAADAAAAREPMAQVSSGGLAGASELQWGMPKAAIDGVRNALIERNDVGAVERSMRSAGVLVSAERLQAAKNYLFNSRGISFDRANVEAWKRLASERAQVRDVAFLVHELAEIRGLEAERARSGFDYRGTNVDKMSATERARWDGDFQRHYLKAHADALAAEYDYIADAVARATSGRVQIKRNLAASVDPTRSEALAYMLVDGRPLSEHRDFPAWRARAGEAVEVGAGARERLGLASRTPTLAELVAAVKYARGGPGATSGAGRSGFTSLLPPAGDPTARSGRSGAESRDPRVQVFLDSIPPLRAARFTTAGHVAALHTAPHVVDFLVRPGGPGVDAFEAFVISSRLAPTEAIGALDTLLAARPELTSDNLNAFANQLKQPLNPPRSRPTSRAELVAAAVKLAGDPRYASSPARAVFDLWTLVGDNVELPVALSELQRASESGVIDDTTVAGRGTQGPDIAARVSGQSLPVGREMVETSPDGVTADAPEATARTQLENALANNLSSKIVGYTSAKMQPLAEREIIVQVRASTAGYNFDRLLTPDFLDQIVGRARGMRSVHEAGAGDLIDRIVFYDSEGNLVHIWKR